MTATNNMHSKVALIMAGGTGGHIFPGLAVAEALRKSGWRVHWIGAPDSMESRLVTPLGFAFEKVNFSGVRGKGLASLAMLPFRLLKAFWQSAVIIRRVKPHVVLGFGGYISFPSGLMAALMRKPLILHEQNSVAGLSNKVLALAASRVFTAFPNVLKKGKWVGNPLRIKFLNQHEPETRFAGRSGPLRLLVVGGSLGSTALNEVVPKALAMVPEFQRPSVLHQSGRNQIDALRANYLAAGVKAELTAFIEDTASEFAKADWVICRSGASTVTELAAVGVAATLVPFPHAVDDHQTSNARFLSDDGAAQLVQQSQLTPQWIANALQQTDRSALLETAKKAKKMQKIYATEAMVEACFELTLVSSQPGRHV